MTHKIKVAFVCLHKSCRSQMAEPISKLIAGDDFKAYSAGTETKPQINQDAVSVINELYGVDMNQTQTLPCKYREDWGLDDPTGKDKNEFIRTAQIIEQKVMDLKSRINNL